MKNINRLHLHEVIKESKNNINYLSFVFNYNFSHPTANLYKFKNDYITATLKVDEKTDLFYAYAWYEKNHDRMYIFKYEGLTDFNIKEFIYALSDISLPVKHYLQALEFVNHFKDELLKTSELSRRKISE